MTQPASSEKKEEYSEQIDSAPTLPSIKIDDTPPQRVRDWGDVVSIVVSFIFIAAVLFIFVSLRGTAEGVESDVKSAGEGLHWLIQLPLTFLQSLTMLSIVGAVIIQLILSRMWIQTISSALGLIGGFGVANLLSFFVSIYAPSTIGLAIMSTRDWYGSGPFELFTALAAFLTAAGRHTSRKSIKWSWNVLFVLGAIVLVTTTVNITTVIVGLALGRAIGLAFRFGIGTQSTGIWGRSLAVALANVGVKVTELRRLPVDDENHPAPSFLDDLTEMSRLYAVTSADGDKLIVSVGDEQRHTVSYLVQLWQGLKFSNLSFRRDRSVRETTEHHLTMLLALEKLGLSQAPLAMGESGESSFLVFASPNDSDDVITALDLTTASDEQLIGVLESLKEAHLRGITHRYLTEECLGMSGSAPVIAGWSKGDVASTHAHIQVDRVQILAIFAASLGIERTLTVARELYSDRELASIAPFMQDVAVPPHTKTTAQWNRKLLKELRERLNELAPSEELGGGQPVELARFNLRKFITILLVIIAVIVVFTQLNFDEVIAAVKNANPWYAVLAFALGIVSWCGSAVAFGVFIDKDMRRYDGILGTQAVASFTAVSMPASVGPIAVNLQFLRKIGYSTTRATAIASADMVAEFGTTILLFLAVSLFTGEDISSALPGKSIIMVIGVLGVIFGVAMLIPKARKWVQFTFLPSLKSYMHQLAQLFSRPAILALSSSGSVVQNGTLAISFWVCLLAFGYNANIFETMSLFLLANAVGSAVPTPGGLGAVETALTVAFTGIGVPSTIALPATLLFRVCTYWLRIPLGAAYMKYMERKGML